MGEGSKGGKQGSFPALAYQSRRPRHLDSAQGIAKCSLFDTGEGLPRLSRLTEIPAFKSGFAAAARRLEGRGRKFL